jgi:hypothetical protein
MKRKDPLDSNAPACNTAQTKRVQAFTTGHIKSNFTFDIDFTGDK